MPICREEVGTVEAAGEERLRGQPCRTVEVEDGRVAPDAVPRQGANGVCISIMGIIMNPGILIKTVLS